MHKDAAYYSIEGDDEDLAGSNVISLSPRLAAQDALSLGALVALVVADAAVRMRGDFDLPRIRVVPAIREGLDREHP